MLGHLRLPAALALIVAAGVLGGLWTDRWRPSREAREALDRLPRIPMRVGPWRGRDVEAPGGAHYARAGIAAHLARSYSDAESGATVDVLLVCGRPGPITAHTPQTCLGEAGYEETAPPVGVALPAGVAGPATFRRAEFTRLEAGAPETRRVYWAWRAADGTAWDAPAGDGPRVAFALHGALYKLYASRLLSPADTLLDEDPCEGFLRLFLPELERALFAGPDDAPGTPRP
jgi:hypothetical protein